MPQNEQIGETEFFVISQPTQDLEARSTTLSLRVLAVAICWWFQIAKLESLKLGENLAGSTRGLAEKYKKLFANIAKTHHKTQAGLKICIYELFTNYYIEGLVDYMVTGSTLSFVVTGLSF